MEALRSIFIWLLFSHIKDSLVVSVNDGVIMWLCALN